MGILAGCLSLFAYLFYNWTIITGKTRPNRVTWWILSLAGLMILMSYYSEGARESIWVPLAYVIGPLIIALLSIKYGVGGGNYFDLVCLFTAVISLVVWLLSGSAFWALVINIVTDFLGLLPTIRKSYFSPLSEDKRAWAIETIASILNLASIKTTSFPILLYPLYLVVVNSGITLILIYRRSSLRIPRREK